MTNSSSQCSSRIELTDQKRHSTFQYNGISICSTCADIFGVLYEVLFDRLHKKSSDNQISQSQSTSPDQKNLLMVSSTSINGLQTFKRLQDFAARKLKEESYTPEDPSPMAREGVSRTPCLSRQSSNHFIKSKRVLEVNQSHHSSSLENQIQNQPIKLEGIKLSTNHRTEPVNTRDFNLFFGFKQPYSRPQRQLDKTKEEVFKINDNQHNHIEPPKQIGNIAQPISKIAIGSQQ